MNVVKRAVLKTRPGKDQTERLALQGHWTDEAAQAGFSNQQLLGSVRAAGVARPCPEG